MSSMSAFSSCLVRQRLLIKPFQRLEFVVLFVFVTLISHKAFSLFFWNLPSSFFSIYPENSLGNNLIIGLVLGSFQGTTQWLVLRRFIPNLRWILANVIGVSMLILVVFLNSNWTFLLREKLYESGQMPDFYWLISGFLLILMIPALIILGWTQWLVIRSYIEPARWWIFLPLCFTGLFLLISYPWNFWSAYILSKLDSTILFTGSWTTIQAICFCLLRQKDRSIEISLNSESCLRIAPEMTNYYKIQQLSRKLYSKLNQAWRSDLTSRHPLIYWLWVTKSASIVACHPVNQASSNSISQTPLPNLIENTSATDREKLSHLALASFQVTFTPPASIKIYSLKGIPLLWSAIVMIILIILIAAHPTWFALVTYGSLFFLAVSKI